MPRNWQLQDAKAKLSELIKRATSEGPQVVTLHGVETAVVLSIKEYRRLQRKQPSFVDHLLSGPKFDDETLAVIDDRPRDMGRDVEL
jgi:prevent-host-death family protein